MSKTWLYSDPHFGHVNILKFGTYKGNRLRPLWDDIDKHDEDLIRWYNEVVSPEDKVYILGDVAMSRKGLDKSLPRLMGRKILVKGNHDTDKLSYYSQYFDDVRSVVDKHGFVLSHVPLHPGSLERWGLNIHGHLHDGVVRLDNGRPDSRYHCVCVEQTNWRPILLDTILKEHKIK